MRERVIKLPMFVKIAYDELTGIEVSRSIAYQDKCGNESFVDAVWRCMACEPGNPIYFTLRLQNAPELKALFPLKTINTENDPPIWRKGEINAGQDPKRGRRVRGQNAQRRAR